MPLLRGYAVNILGLFCHFLKKYVFWDEFGIVNECLFILSVSDFFCSPNQPVFFFFLETQVKLEFIFSDWDGGGLLYPVLAVCRELR